MLISNLPLFSRFYVPIYRTFPPGAQAENRKLRPLAGVHGNAVAAYQSKNNQQYAIFSYPNSEEDVMQMMIAKCGLDCAGCDAYKAWANNDDELRQKTAELWSRQYNHAVKPEDINCVGCQAEGVHIGYCSICEIRTCATKRNLANCAVCPDYGCEKLAGFLRRAPLARTNLEEIRAGR
jgi:hypothetical protein